jgi:hypothetical protein
MDVYNICNLGNLEGVYYLLKLSPPLKGKLTFTWIQDHMEYEILAATLMLNMDTPQTPPGTIASTISDSSTWQQFHQLIFPLL